MRLDHYHGSGVALDIRYDLLPIKSLIESSFTSDLIRYIVHHHGTFHSQRLYYVVTAIYSMASTEFQPIMADEQLILSLLRIFYRYRSDLSMIKTILGLFRELIHKSQSAQQLLLKHGVLTEMAAICRPTTSQSILLRIGWVIYALTHCHNNYQKMELFPISQILSCLSVLIMYDDPSMLRFVAPCYCLLLWHQKHHQLLLDYGMDTAKLKHEMLTKLERDKMTVNLWIQRQELNADTDESDGFSGSFPDIPNVIGGLITTFYSPFTRPQIQNMDCNKVRRFVDLTVIRGGNGRIQRASVGSLTQLLRHGNVQVEQLREYGVIEKICCLSRVCTDRKSQKETVSMYDPRGSLSKMALDLVLQIMDKTTADEELRTLHRRDCLISLLQKRMERTVVSTPKMHNVYQAIQRIVEVFGKDGRVLVVLDLVDRLKALVDCESVKKDNKVFVKKWISQLQSTTDIEWDSPEVDA